MANPATERLTVGSFLKKDWKALLIALSLLVVGAMLVRWSAPAASTDNTANVLAWPRLLAAVLGLILVGIGQALVIFKLIEERALAASAKEQKYHVEKAVETATEAIVDNLDRTFSVVGDCRREHLLEVLPPRRKPGLPEKNPEHFKRLWKYFVDSLATSCAKEDTRKLHLRLCSIAETDIFHNDGKLTEKFATLLKTRTIEEDDGTASWFCGCGMPETCNRELVIQVIILAPDSAAAGVRTAAEGAAHTNQVLEDINRTIRACKDLAKDMQTTHVDLPSVVRLELATVDHHPLTSFIHTPDWVQIELIHWGRKSTDPNESYECLGGRVPVLIFAQKSLIHSFLEDQFDLQWKTPFSRDPGGLGWLGSKHIDLLADAEEDKGDRS